jgi:ferritin-like metal-binding protein YciE
MEKMNDLRALLMHDMQLLLSAEQQILEAMPAMIAKAHNPELKRALEEHRLVTETHIDRLNNLRQMMHFSEENVTKYNGVLSGIMGDPTECKGMAGLISEGQRLMDENICPEVMDAAIVCSCQKIEHFEIASYGTARSYAEQLGMYDVVQTLQQTLDEEYAADRRLTDLALSEVNVEAELHA